MVHVWPASLPQRPLVDTPKMSPEDVRVTSEPDGPPEVRARTSSAGETVSMRFAFDADQYSTFWAFWTATLSHGAAQFTIPHPFTGATATACFLAAPQVARPQPSLALVDVTLYLEP